MGVYQYALPHYLMNLNDGRSYDRILILIWIRTTTGVLHRVKAFGSSKSPASFEGLWFHNTIVPISYFVFSIINKINGIQPYGFQICINYDAKYWQTPTNNG